MPAASAKERGEDSKKPSELSPPLLIPSCQTVVDMLEIFFFFWSTISKSLWIRDSAWTVRTQVPPQYQEKWFLRERKKKIKMKPRKWILLFIIIDTVQGALLGKVEQ